MNDPAMRLLERLGSCGVSDVLDSLELPRSLLVDVCPVTVRRAVAGPVATVQLAPVEPGEARPRHHLCASTVDSSPAGTIVVVAVAGDPHISGAWGGLLGLAAHIRGLRATVVSGDCRDTDELRELGYPVYAHGSTPITARGRLKEVAAGVPVTIGSAVVHPDDVAVADGDGVIVIARQHLDAVLDAGRIMLDKEAAFAEQIRANRSLVSVLDGDYESLTDRTEA